MILNRDDWGLQIYSKLTEANLLSWLDDIHL